MKKKIFLTLYIYVRTRTDENKMGSGTRGNLLTVKNSGSGVVIITVACKIV